MSAPQHASKSSTGDFSRFLSAERIKRHKSRSSFKSKNSRHTISILPREVTFEDDGNMTDFQREITGSYQREKTENFVHFNEREHSSDRNFLPSRSGRSTGNESSEYEFQLNTLSQMTERNRQSLEDLHQQNAQVRRMNSFSLTGINKFPRLLQKRPTYDEDDSAIDTGSIKRTDKLPKFNLLHHFSDEDSARTSEKSTQRTQLPKLNNCTLVLDQKDTIDSDRKEGLKLPGLGQYNTKLTRGRSFVHKPREVFKFSEQTKRSKDAEYMSAKEMEARSVYKCDRWLQSLLR